MPVTMRYDPVTDWRLCARVNPRVLLAELRAVGCCPPLRCSDSESSIDAPSIWPGAVLYVPSSLDSGNWCDAVCDALHFLRHIRTKQTDREVTQWAVLRRLLWRSNDVVGLLWLAWHWAATRVKTRRSRKYTGPILGG